MYLIIYLPIDLPISLHLHIYVAIYVCMYVCMYVYMYIYIYTVCPPAHSRCPDCCVPFCSLEVGGWCDAWVLFTTAYYEDICTAAGGGIDETSYTNFVWESRLRQCLYFCTSTCVSICTFTGQPRAASAGNTASSALRTRWCQAEGCVWISRFIAQRSCA